MLHVVMAAGSHNDVYWSVEPPLPNGVVIEVPHAGLHIPADLQPVLDVDPMTVRLDSDIAVDRLCTGLDQHGAALLMARISRYVVDLNRAPDDVDPRTVEGHPNPKGAQGRGVVWRLTVDGRPVMPRALSYPELLGRLQRYHVPYHRELRRLLAVEHAVFTDVTLLAVHSMPSTGLGGELRADIVPGTRGRRTSSADRLEIVEQVFRGGGLSVVHDDPYQGGYTTGHYGVPDEGVHAIQIEVNRGLYVSERDGSIKPEAVHRLRLLFSELVQRLALLAKRR